MQCSKLFSVIKWSRGTSNYNYVPQNSTLEKYLNKCKMLLLTNPFKLSSPYLTIPRTLLHLEEKKALSSLRSNICDCDASVGVTVCVHMMCVSVCVCVGVWDRPEGF